MKNLLHDFFNELGMPDHAKGVLESNHRFILKNYMQMFEIHIKRDDLIVSKERADEMFYEYRIKKYENFYGAVC